MNTTQGPSFEAAAEPLIIRIYQRAYVAPEQLAGFLRSAARFYGARATIRFTMPAEQMTVIGLESPTVNLSVVSAPSTQLEPFLDTAQTVLVTDVDEALARVLASGGRVVQPRTAVPPGAQARGQLPGGPVIEFAQWDHAAPYLAPDLSDLGISESDCLG